MTLTLDDDSVRIAELRLFAARSEFRESREVHERAREQLFEADRVYRRVVDAVRPPLQHHPEPLGWND
ncbi:hypothetical protein [Protaetiibacter intestinalis]|uniref:Uncharacterized protein n=1 Tax=Protaetiibacter intestinalis TaxID=2419774 RepID=A0A387BEM5_9MICO|nr:hypothetical protein [Protaetiibacter intestinalis]AYF96930.1 hypothetical protein D7I47_00775 [Protaetiibacter intestinalis]